jgi:hypothetical protein
MLLNLGLNNDKRIHTLPLQSVSFHISPYLSLPLQTLHLVCLVSLITKTKRIAERSDTNCDTHTHTHTQTKYPRLVGFGLACAPVRCAHPSFLGSLTCKTGRCAPPLPIAASLLLTLYPPNLSLRPELGPPGVLSCTLLSYIASY